MTALLLQLLAWVVVAILRHIITRYQWMEEGQKTEYEEALRRAEIAFKWKTSSPTVPGSGDLGVRPGASPITLPGYYPTTPSPAADPTVPSAGGDSVRSGS